MKNILNNKRLLIAISSIVVLLIIIVLVVVLLANGKKENTLSNTTTEETTIHNTPSTNAVVTQGQVPEGDTLMQWLPTIDVGTIGDVIQTPQGISVNVLNLTLEGYQYYLAKTQEAGFVYNIDSTSSTNTILYSAQNANGIVIRTSYAAETARMSLVVSQIQ